MIRIPSDPLAYIQSNPRTIHKSYHSVLHKNGFPSSVNFGFNSVLVTDSKLVKHTLDVLPKSNLIYDWLSNPTPNSRFLGKGILTSEGDFWKMQRQPLEKKFSNKSIQDSKDTMTYITKQYIDSMSPFDVDCNLQQLTSEITISIISTLLFGDVFTSEAKQNIEYYSRIITSEITTFLNPLNKLAAYSPQFTTYMGHMCDYVRLLCKEALNSRTEKQDDMLQLIIDSSSDIEQCIDNTLSFFLAGYDTSATTLTWALYLLYSPENKPILELLMNQVSSKPFEEIALLDYILYETLRLYPATGGGILRQYNTEYNDKGWFPSDWNNGLHVIVPIYSLHRNPRVWDAPNVFWPHRWEHISMSDVMYDFIPFSQGPRNCIGKHFAMLEMKIILYQLVKKCYFSGMPSFVDSELHVVMQPDQDIQCGMLKRILLN